LFGYLYIFLSILSPLEIFRTIYRSQEIIFSDLLYIRNNIKVRTILRICSKYVLKILNIF